MTKSTDGNQSVLDRFAKDFEATDSVIMISRLRETVTALHNAGYLTASLDSISSEDNKFEALIYVGPQFNWGEINLIGIPDDWKKPGIGKYADQRINAAQYGDTFSKLTTQASNSGYPFAKAHLDSITILDNSIFGDLIFEPGPLIQFDTVEINGTLRANKYISSYLRIRQGQPYNERKVNQIPEYFENMSYYNLDGPVELVFHDDQATIELDVERVNSNRFDGIIGLLPNASQKAKTLLTGELNLELLNPFESGKEIKIHWQRLREETLSLDIGLKFPFVLSSPLSITGNYKQLKEDTTFINRDGRIGGQVNLSSRSNFDFFVNMRSAGLLSTTQQFNEDNLPENIDFNLTRYGIGYSFYTLNQRDVSDQGVALNSEFSLGNRNIQRDANFDDEIYSSLKERSTFYQLEVGIVYQKRIRNSIFLYQGLHSGHVINERLFKTICSDLAG